MSEADGYVKISALIDPTGATDGANRVIQDVDRIEGKTKTGAATMDTAALGNLRSVHHLLTGLFELGQGGQAAFGGLAMEGRIATEVFEGMLGPLAPIALAITTITALAVPMLQQWQEHLTKIADAKDSTNDLKEAATDYKDEIDAILASQKQVEDSDKRQLDAIKGKVTAEAELIKIQKEAAIEKARSEYLAKLTPDMPEADRKKAKEQFEAQKTDIEGASDVASSNLAVKTKVDEIAQQKKDLADTQSGMRLDQKKLQDAQDAAASGANFLALAGIKADDKGNLTSPDGSNAAKAQQKKINETSQKLIALREQLTREAATQAEHHDRPDAEFQASQQRGAAEVKQLSNQLDQQTLHLADMRNAAQAILDYKEAREKFGKAIETDSDKISAQRDALDQATGELNRLTQAALVAGQKAVNNQKELAATTGAEEWQKGLKGFQKQRDEELEARLGAAQASLTKKPDDKATEDLIASLKIEAIKNKQWDAVAEGNKDKGFFDLTNQQIKDIGTVTGAKENKQTDAATRKADEQQLQVMKSKIEGSHNPQAIAELKAEISKHLGNVSAQLESLLRIIIDNHVVPLTSAMGQFKDKLSENSTKVDRLHHP